MPVKKYTAKEIAASHERKRVYWAFKAEFGPKPERQLMSDMNHGRIDALEDAYYHNGDPQTRGRRPKDENGYPIMPPDSDTEPWGPMEGFAWPPKYRPATPPPWIGEG
ncbi:hypothetical protein IEU95_16050 [Hoyosella rhizosphaerae]|uniref:Uncharacterized protein n=1 Tax=Hoyosella rhizosphaerae TaxID=1755582 RepID=A0A916UJD4_9ACTN|nr:hypothetical protein [Hoyosella rhizosphaerae]MBN4928347.1 hypothetical protein [Hoyosella rhizosphaerae]GGC74267.1 hypothetical protein GCM10011410_29390 [Hoyosella rhizosphaerae]